MIVAWRSKTKIVWMTQSGRIWRWILVSEGSIPSPGMGLFPSAGVVSSISNRDLKVEVWLDSEISLST